METDIQHLLPAIGFSQTISSGQLLFYYLPCWLRGVRRRENLRSDIVNGSATSTPGAPRFPNTRQASSTEILFKRVSQSAITGLLDFRHTMLLDSNFVTRSPRVPYVPKVQEYISLSIYLFSFFQSMLRNLLTVRTFTPDNQSLTQISGYTTCDFYVVNLACVE